MVDEIRALLHHPVPEYKKKKREENREREIERREEELVRRRDRKGGEEGYPAPSMMRRSAPMTEGML